MATVEDVARSLVGTLGADADYLRASKWVADRYKQIFARVKARHLRNVRELIVPPTISAGTVTMTRDSNIVTGDATARAAWAVVGGAQGAPGQQLAGRYIRTAVAWYLIDGIRYTAGNTELMLRSTFAESSVAGGAYIIASRINGLDPDVRWIGETMINMSRRFPLTRLSIEELDTLAPSRDRAGGAQIASGTGEGAQVFCEHGDVIKDGKLCKGIEVYPYSSTSEIYHYIAYPVPPSLRYTDSIPPELDEHVLREGAIIDYMRYKMAQALMATPPRIEEAATWRNDYRAQETKWEAYIMQAIRADRATDDITFILQRSGWTQSSRDIISAYDMILHRWPR